MILTAFHALLDCFKTFSLPTFKPQGLKHALLGLDGTTQEAAEKVVFMALRFATLMPAAARKGYFPTTYGTAEAVPFRKTSRKLSFSAASKVVP